jgi:hypothetical protein
VENSLKKIAYIGKSLLTLTRRFPADQRLKLIHDLLAYMRPNEKLDVSEHLVVECVQDPFYLTLFTHITYTLRQRMPLNVELIVIQSINSAIGFGVLQSIRRSFPINRLQVNQWVRIWDVVATKIAYRSTSLCYPLGDIIDAWRSWRIWMKLNSAGDLEAISVGGVSCGDLVIDSYLRFRPSPRVVVGDLFMLHVLWQAHRDVRRAQRYFRSTKPLLYLVTYTTYVEHGIAARVALQEGVHLISFGNYQEFGKFHSADDFFHTRNALGYLHDFNLLPDPAPLLEMARRQLEARLAGGIDIATSYMATPAYLQTTNEVPNVQDAVIVFLHDFYDSPHVYADLVFPDFWEWICFTLDTLRSVGIRCLVKPHPNQISLSDLVINELLERFPDMELIASEVTNRQLVDAGMACAVTVYGTVAHEMAYMGVPTISCARHPHIAFDFCRTAKNRADYADLLCNALTPAINRALMREQALQFFVMHNLNYSVEQIQLRDALINARKAFDNPLINATELVDHFDKLVKLPHFSNFIDRIHDELVSTKKWI